ncbi:MAG: ATP-binding cassette domain-containing protein [Saprospiraceae bacterium]
MIIAENITVGAGIVPILEGVNWIVKKGEHWVVTGDNAAGKSSLAKCLVGKNRVMKGRLHFPFLGNTPDFKTRNQAIHMVSFTDTSKLFRSANIQHYYQQRYNAFDADGHLSVRNYLVTGGFDESDPFHQNMVEILRLEGLLDKERIKLSSGQTRKMLLAKALIKRPQLLILDNPYIGLDLESRQLLNTTLDELVRNYDICLILVGQVAELPKCISHRLHLAKGEVAAAGPLSTVQTQLPAPAPNIAEVHLRNLRQYFQQEAKPLSADHIFKLDKVTINYGQTRILDQLNWRVLPGEKWMLKGENGAGKSTLLSLIYGDNPQAYAHQVYLFDKKRGHGESIWDIKKRIGFTSPELHAYYDEEHLAQEVVWSGLSDSFFVPRKVSAEKKAFVVLMFQYFGIEKHLNQPFSQLSTGIQRLLFFMRALVKVPPVLLLDEPFQGFDQQTIRRCQRLLESVLDERFTLIFITHFKAEVPAIVNKEFFLAKKD